MLYFELEDCLSLFPRPQILCDRTCSHFRSLSLSPRTTESHACQRGFELEAHHQFQLRSGEGGSVRCEFGRRTWAVSSLKRNTLYLVEPELREYFGRSSIPEDFARPVIQRSFDAGQTLMRVFA